MKIEFLPIILLLCMTAAPAIAAEADLPLFDAVWETVCRRHYDPDFAARNRERLYDAYRPQVIAAQDPAAVREIINRMLTATGESHLQLLPAETDTGSDTSADTDTGTAPRAGSASPAADGTDAAIRFKSGHLQLQVEYESERLSETVGRIRFSAFVPAIIKRFRKDLKTGLADCRGIIIDLRDNPGGVMDTATYLASWCVPRCIPMGTLTLNGVELKPRSTPQPGGFRGKIAILIDGGSASTAEIFAAAMQDNGAARLFGSKTPGMCLPSQIVAMPDGSRLQTVFGDILRPDGTRIEGIGVTPDVPCPADQAVEQAARWIDETSIFEEIFKWWN